MLPIQPTAPDRSIKAILRGVYTNWATAVIGALYAIYCVVELAATHAEPKPGWVSWTFSWAEFTVVTAVAVALLTVCGAVMEVRRRHDVWVERERQIQLRAATRNARLVRHVKEARAAARAAGTPTAAGASEAVMRLQSFRVDGSDMDGCAMFVAAYGIRRQPWALDDLAIVVFGGSGRFELVWADSLAREMERLMLVALTGDLVPTDEVPRRNLMMDQRALRVFVEPLAGSVASASRASRLERTPAVRLAELLGRLDGMTECANKALLPPLAGTMDMEYARKLAFGTLGVLEAYLHTGPFRDARDALVQRAGLNNVLSDGTPLASIYGLREWLVAFRPTANESMIRLDNDPPRPR